MIWCFKNIKVKYLLTVIPVSILILLLLGTKTVRVDGVDVTRPLFPFSFLASCPYVGLLLLLGWIIFCWTLFNRQAGWEFLKITDILNRECDPEAFIRTLLLRFPPHKRFTGFLHTLLLLNLSIGWYEEGQLGRMLNCLQNIVCFPQGKAGNTYRFIYYDHWFCYYFEKRELDQADRMLACMRKLLDAGCFSGRKTGEGFRLLFLQNECGLKFYRGEPVDWEGIMTRAFEEADSLREKVHAKSALGEMYRKESRWEQSEDCFRYVVQNGNRLSVAGRAEALLKQGIPDH